MIHITPYCHDTQMANMPMSETDISMLYKGRNIFANPNKSLRKFGHRTFKLATTDLLCMSECKCE